MKTYKIWTFICILFLVFTNWYGSSFLKLDFHISAIFSRHVLYTRVGNRRESGGDLALSVLRQGRLGNGMWQYSALYGLANLTNRIPLLSGEFRDLENAFSLSISRETTEKRTAGFYVYNQRDMERKYSVEETAKALTNVKQDVMLDGFFQYYGFFAHVSDDIRTQFVFKEHIKREVAAFFREFQLSDDDLVKVGIHIRRGDLARDDWVRKGFGPPDTAYFINAMNYFRKKHKQVHFVLCSDDLKWARQHVRGNDVTFVDNLSPELDMAILTSCDHVIISNGTFSWWVGWLCRGVTVRCKDIPRPNTLLYNMTSGGYWPPNDDYNHYLAIDSS